VPKGLHDGREVSRGEAGELGILRSFELVQLGSVSLFLVLPVSGYPSSGYLLYVFRLQPTENGERKTRETEMEEQQE
jgi:hypothetical protein